MKQPIAILRSLVADIEALQDPRNPNDFGPFSEGYNGENHGGTTWHVTWPNLAIVLTEAKGVLAHELAAEFAAGVQAMESYPVDNPPPAEYEPAPLEENLMPNDQDTYSTILVETVLCVWEVMLDDRSEPGSTNPAFQNHWDQNGIYAMRHEAMKIGRWVDQVWKAADGDDERFDGYAFDFEICPVLVHMVEWGDGHKPPVLPDIADAVAQLRREFPPFDANHQQA